MEEIKNLGFDVDGFDYVSTALLDTINSFPGLEPGEKFTFSTVPNEEGMTVIASAGSAVIEHHESITDHVWEICAYPFTVVYRTSGLASGRKVTVKEWMDSLARWLTRQTVKIGGTEYHLERWPVLEGDRRIKTIIRQSPAYLASVNEDKSENWVMDLVIQYHNEFDR